MEHPMSNKIEFKYGDETLARYIPSELAWSGGLNFFSEDTEFVQVGSWVYEKGRILNAHIHKYLPREVGWTQEVIFVKQGKVLARIYNAEAEQIAEQILLEGDVLILLSGGHGYEILEEGTKVLELKNGPYKGAHADRRRIE
jgi:hypothetical protein